MIEKIKIRARALKRDAYALYLAYRDPRIRWYARAFIALVVAYAFSPIDLIPDFIPVLGYLDDLILIPLGVTLALKMIPAEVIAEARQNAEELIHQGKPVSRAGVVIVITLWVLVLAGVAWSVIRTLSH